MMLPEWTEAGLLPPGVHRTELADIYERLVLDAPHRSRRELLFTALSAHVMLVQTVIPSGLAWIGGSFCAGGPDPPEDVDIVIKPADWKALRSAPGDVKARLYALLTLQDVAATYPPVVLPRLQPVGGAIDAFLCSPGQDATWHGQWSSVLDETRNVVSGKVKGFAEVAW